MKLLNKLLFLSVTLITVAVNAQTTLSIGDISIIGFNSNSPDNFTFVCWVNLSNTTQIKFTDNGFLSSNTSTTTNNGRGGENFVTWTNNTGSTIIAGTVIKIENGTTPSIGTVSLSLSGISNAGDQIFVYQGSGAGTSNSTSDWGSNGNPTTLSGTLLYGLNFQSSWLTAGTTSSNTSYLPSDINVSNGNIVHSGSSVTSAQYTGSRNNQSSITAYRTLVNNPSNWTTATGSATTTLSGTSFTSTCTPPGTQVSALNFSGTSANNTTLAWTNGSGTNTIVLVKSGSAVSSNPVSGQSYTASTTFGSGTQIGSGNYVTYDGSGDSVSITGLTASTNYHFAVFTHDSSGINSCFKVPGATANVTTLCSTPVNVNGNSISRAKNNKATISWKNSACFDEVYVFADQTSGLGTSPSGNGSAYTANALYASNGQCIYKGTGSNVNVNGLLNGARYYFEIYTRKGTNWSSGVEDSATPVLAPVMTELVVPQYMGSKTDSSVNDARTPIAVCLQFDNLIPSITYNIKIGLALTSEASTEFGSCNIFNDTGYSGLVKLSAFTSNGNGSSGPVWFFIQPTGSSSRFGGAQVHELRVAIDTSASFASIPDFEGAKTITALDIQNTATAPTTDDGAFIKGSTCNSFSGKYILAFNNISGSGDPIYAYQVISATASNTSQSALPTDLNDVYLQNGSSAVGDFPVVVPIGTNNTNGVRRFEFRNPDNTFFASVTDADGNWGTGTNTSTIARKDLQEINLFQGIEENIRIYGDVVLPDSLTITGSLTLDSGKLKTSASNMLTLKNTCTVSPAGGTASSFVDGPMEWEVFGNSEVILPLGKGTEWAKLSILPLQNDSRGTQTRKYHAEYFKTGYGAYNIDTAQTNPLLVVSTNEFWEVSETSNASGSDLECKIKLFWRTISNTSVNASERLDLRVAHYRSGRWSYEGASPAILDYGMGSGSVQSDWVTNFSPFTFGSVTSLNPLPVSLISISSYCNHNGNIVQWQVAEDINVNYYKIDRLQDHEFYPLTTINSLKQNLITQYVYQDLHAKNNSIYRISEIHSDETINLLATVQTNCLTRMENTIRIVQSVNEIQVNFGDVYSEYSLNNIEGQEVQSGNFQNNLNINKAFISPGVYILVVKELNTHIKIYVY